MKKFLFFLTLLLFSFNTYSQFTEGFENTTGPDAFPSTNWTLESGNWAVFDNSIGTQRWGINATISTPVTVYQGTNAAYISRDNIGQGNTSENYLATPAVQIPTNGELHFFTRMFTSGNQGTIYQIKVAPASASQIDISAYSLVQQWTESELIVPTTNFNIYTEKTVDLSAFAGTFVYISFVKVFTQPTTSIDGDRWLIDSVGINSQCLSPTGLTFSAITTNGATLNWLNPNGSGTTWEIEVVPASGTPTGIPTNTTSTLPYIVTGLLPNTTYKYYVRAVCSTGFTSAWSAVSANFTTGTAPPVCGGNFVDSGGVGGNYANNENITTTICPTNPGDQVTVTFTSFNIQNSSDLLKVYDGNNASAPLLATLTGTTLPPAFTSSAVSGCLTFVFTSNATTTAAGWVSNVTCAPAPTCSIPTAVTNSTVTSSSVSVSWTQPANPNSSVATAWQVLALPCGSAAPTASSTGFVSATSNPFTLTGLSPVSCYDIYVRAVCSASDSSAWSRIASSFTTQAAPPICGGNFVDTGGTTGNYSDNANSTTTICPTNVGDLVTVTFTSFSLESCCDSLKIYDGSSPAGALLGTYTGTTLPPTYTSSIPNGCLTFVFTSDSSINQTGWIANVTCSPAPTCSKPISLTNSTVTATSVILSWTQPANPNTTTANAWQVLALPCGSPAPTASSTGFVTASTNPFTLTGLNPTTCYAVYVRAACSASDRSAWSALTTFTTQALPPVCGGNFVDTGGTTGNYTDNANVTTTICPVNTGDLVTVTFTAFSLESCCDSLKIYDGSNVSAPLLGTYTGTSLPPTYTSSTPNGCLTFVFTSDSSINQTGWISNVTCTPAPTCSKPISLTNSTVTATSAILSWTQPANPDTTIPSSWQVLALTCGSPSPTAASTGFVNANSNPFTLTGLTSLTCYDVYVRAACSASDSSAWSALTTFTTQALPPVCGGNFVDTGGPTGIYNNNANITTTICPTNIGDLVTVSFTSFSLESGFDFLRIYDGDNASAPLLGSYTGTAIPPTFTSNATSGCLTFVFTSDFTGTQAGWTSNVTCAPAPLCRKPTNLTTSTVTNNSVNLAWTNVGNATSWQVLALTCGSPTPNETTTGWVTALTNPFVLNGLFPNTCYNLYVRGNCGSDGVSEWSNLATITTQIAPPGCGGNFLDSGVLSNYANNSNIGTLICPSSPTDKVTITFTSFDTENNNDILRIYNGNSATAPLIGSYSGTNLPPPITSSATNGCLYFVFISNGSITQAGWSSNITCAPAAACPNPLGVTASNVVTTTSQLSWVEAGNANSWQILTLPCGSPAPTNSATGWISTNSNPYTVTGLTPNCCNKYYVRSVCSGSETSNWTPAYQNLAGSYVVWNSASDASTLSGTYPGGTVTLSFTGAGNAVTIDSPAGTATNLVVTGNNTFATNGPSDTPPSRRLTFTFSTPVIIDRYSMADIDIDTWDDSFDFVGVTFTSTTSTNVTTTLTGAVATSIGGNNSAYASWFGSTTPVTSFSINYLTTGGLTHAYLAYALKVATICPIPLATLNVSVNNPIVCQGTPANVIATPSTLGTYNYIWTVPSGASNPGNVASFFTNVAGIYSVIITDTTSGATSPNASGTVTVNTPVISTFNAIPAICNGGTTPLLPLTSIESITGTWLPNTINNSQTTTYNFTPTIGQCASPGSIIVTVNDNITPTFTTPASICLGTTAPTLPLSSLNGIAGTWLPTVVDNTQTATYAFTPNSGQCASSASVVVTVNNNVVVPTFISPAPICTGGVAPTLPLTSLNGITGTWLPNVVDNTQTATYTFTPNSGQCASTTTLSVTVYQDCSFGSFASAVWLTNCENNDFFNTVGSGASIIGPVTNVFPNTDFGTYISNSNTFKLRGAEVKTFKSVTANVCSARLNYRIYPQSGTPGAFTILDLPFYNNCVSGSFPSGGPCNPGDQKWQEVLNNNESPIDLTAYPAGDYVLEVFYDVTGDVNATTQCDDTIYINNNGNNYIATYTLQNTPGYFGTNPTTCNGTDGSILITNLAPNTQYDLSYEDDGSPVSTVITSTTNGDYTITGLNAGDYNNIFIHANGCLIASGSYSLFDPITTPTFEPILPICSGETLNPLPTTSIEGITGTWSPAFNNTATTTYTFTPNSSSSSSTNLIPNGDFSAGNTGFTSDYQYLNDAGLSGVQKAYGIVTAANLWFQFFPSCTGHTATSGNIMVVDGSTTNAGNDKVWAQTVTVIPNQDYTFSYWLQTVATPNRANIDVTINGTSIGAITAPATNCEWAQISYTWNSGTSTSAQIAIYDRIILSNGNDFSLDDITFSPNVLTQCATTTDLTITVNEPVAATFNTIPAICSGGIAPSLPATSIEGFTGTWTPSIVDNEQTLPYTFNPTAGQCATSGSVVVTVNPNTTPVFEIGTSIISCAGVSPQVELPTTSQNGITGIWNPSTLDYSIEGTTVYTFTPTFGICATTATLTAIISPNSTPTFTQVLPICSGAQLTALPTTSIEGITGTWSPALNNLGTTLYTFTPTIGLCAVPTTMTIVVNPNSTPTFNAIAPLCTGETAPSLPSPSIEGITGTWSPAVIDNTTSGTYTFTPTAGQCAINGSLSVTVQSAFDFELSGQCVGEDFILEVTAVNNTINLNTANFVWFNSNNQAVGNNSSTFNVTEYLNSTEPIEELPITFSLTVTNSDGCYRTEPITLPRIFCGIQKGISVNNDGDNEFFDLTLLNVKHLSIFNRYGMKVYTKGGYTNEWKGQSDKGDELPDGTYYYVIDFKDNLPAKTGWIYINREN
ncbi:fibronectin type III domain-containing protein [Flavobacterium paronense]|uniref:CUB domain-containing protein n=1 Tax=Flavobacterium paronense TaxID=1392775 RepID=A0ABV5GCY0_9FLAO|nr:CUB domain-containing protein [Flavobacterium paronense]MDN3677713.1 fibronectin type III domain-containing protein [Flavobacterium paronense]